MLSDAADAAATVNQQLRKQEIFARLGSSLLVEILVWNCINDVLTRTC